MSDSMIERVARALRPEGWVSYALGNTGSPTIDEFYKVMRERARERARAAIEAMREPTEAMTDAGFHESTHEEREGVSAIYRAMIDAALK